MLEELNFVQRLATTVHCDNQGTTTLVKNRLVSKRSKHIETRYNYTCNKKNFDEITVVYVPTNASLADPLTKVLCKKKFVNLLRKSGMES